MKIVIEHKRVKREIEGTGFNICGSQEDLLRIANQLLDRINSKEGFGYGWISIRDYVVDEHFAGANTLSKSWE